MLHFRLKKKGKKAYICAKKIILSANSSNIFKSIHVLTREMSQVSD